MLRAGAIDSAPIKDWQVYLKWHALHNMAATLAKPYVDEDFDFEQTLRDIHVELADLNREAALLAARIQENFEGLGL